MIDWTSANAQPVPLADEVPRRLSADAGGPRKQDTPADANQPRFLGAVVPLALLVIWEWGVAHQFVSAHLFPPPSQLAATLVQGVADGSFLGHIAISTVRVLAGFVIGAGLALAVGTLVALSKRLEALLEPTFQGLRAVPSLAWVPLLLLWLGIDEAPKLTLIAIGAFFPVYLATVSGIHGVDRKLVEVGELYGFGRTDLATRILLPAALPSVLTGLRGALSLAWMFMVAAELIAAAKGVGYLLTDGRETGRVDLVLIAIVLLALLGKCSDALMKRLESRLLHWRDAFGGARA